MLKLADIMLLDKLSDVLTYDQKIRKIGKLLTSLRERNEIEIGEKRAWVLKEIWTDVSALRGLHPFFFCVFG